MSCLYVFHLRAVFGRASAVPSPAASAHLLLCPVAAVYGQEPLHQTSGVELASRSRMTHL